MMNSSAGLRADLTRTLMDFEEPEKVQRATSTEDEAPKSPPSGDVEEVQVDEITQEDTDRLQLQDAGEGAQPLRLLPCGHVFHVSLVLGVCVRRLTSSPLHRKRV